MKASDRFVDTLTEGIVKLIEKHGEERIKTAHDMLIYQMIFQSITPGFEHNAKFEAELQPWFEVEAKKLKNAHLLSAIKAARKKAKNGSRA